MFEALGGSKIRVMQDLQVPVDERTARGVSYTVTVPAGYLSDGYTIPAVFWLLVGHPLGQPHLIPAVVHDYLCDIAETYHERVLADATFFFLLSQYDVPCWKRTVFYVGVRIKGAYSLRNLVGMVLGCCLLFAIRTVTAAPPPPTGWTTPARVVGIVDGDTIDVEVSKVVRVRLADCWAPERYHADGPASTANMKRLLPIGSECVLHVPTSSGDLADVFSFGRVIGHVWSAGAEDSVSEKQVEAGFATREKRK